MELLRAQQQAKRVNGVPAASSVRNELQNGLTGQQQQQKEEEAAGRESESEWHPSEQPPDAPAPSLVRTEQLAPLALAAVDVHGLELCRWLGRFQVIRPSPALAYFLDGAHTDESITVRCTLLALENYCPPPESFL